MTTSMTFLNLSQIFMPIEKKPQPKPVISQNITKHKKSICHEMIILLSCSVLRSSSQTPITLLFHPYTLFTPITSPPNYSTLASDT